MSKRLLRAGIFSLVSTSAIVACSGELDGGTRHSFFVRSALAPPANPNHAKTCVFGSDGNAAALFSGTVDFGLRDDYQLTLLLQAGDGADATSVTGAHVIVRQGDVVLEETDAVTSGFVEKGGFGLASLTVIHSIVLTKLEGVLSNRAASVDLVVEISVTGANPTGGSAVSTPSFRFPVKACSGCLVDFSTGNDPVSKPQPNCMRFRSTTDPPATPCFFGQDETVSCELCIGSRPACDPQTP